MDKFHLDEESFRALQAYRNELAVQKLNFQADLDDPNYALKTLRLLAWYDAKLELLTELMEVSTQNL